ncbi:LamG-like jellyroll fold domain-containing protein [Lutibacter sp. TH_r2]|uniref:LamG-like jellyroll fold domain-containing protein n=1 Tax=Lutibacter sp. TH_r2 TaxID=3082083 RepID=UPI0029532173|nr:LamG-like jellyroll fold domain-containing protein [Lutibacter sp. TH_r2]MDV7186508.1 LamG-like jellyroll fold domain-containing protein [Lutibacter sp. TH_r2]
MLKKITFVILLLSISIEIIAQEIEVEHPLGSSINQNVNIDFGANTSETFYIDNSGGNGSNLNVSSIVLSNNTDFSLTSNPAPFTLKGNGGTTSFTISLNASACGNVSSTVTIYHDGSTDSDGEWTFTIEATGASTDPEMDVLLAAVAVADGGTSSPSQFTSTDVGSSTSVTYTIENNGCSSLDLDGTPDLITLGNSTDFLVDFTSTASSIPIDGSTTFTITFSPASSGALSTTVSIPNTDPNEDPYNFTINGTGIVPITEGPGGVTSDLQLWLKSTDGLGYADGDGVSLWETQARGSNATLPTGGLEPTFKDNISDNVNFNPVVDFNNDPTAPVKTYSYSKEVLIGDSGYNTQDIFVVLIPNVTVNPTFGFMDIFCGDENVSTPQTDGSGIGFGDYSARFTNEIISYAVGTTSSGDGYGVAEIGTGNTYSNVGIINARNNSSSTLQELYYNSINVGNTQNDTGDFSNVDSRFWIGRSEGWDGSTDARIAEIITYSSRKDDINYNDERRKIESYLAIKYGITLADAGVGTTQDYVDSAGNIIWDESADAGVYNYDIAGIGRDDDSELNQKQSRSVNSATNVTIGHREIATTNSGNGNNFDNNLDFLVWGHNNDALSGTDDIIVDLGASSTSVTTMFDRRWKIKETCSTGGDVLDVKVSIPTSAFALTAPAPDFITTQPALIISSTANFSDVVDVIPMVADGSGNFETWYDFDDTRYFTFGIATKVEGKHDVSYTTDNFLVGENTVTLNTNYTVSAWVRNLGGGGTFASKNGAYDFRINASGYVEASYNGAIAKTSSVTVNDSKWHHIAISDDGSGVSMYIDGVLDGAKGTSVAPITSIGRFAIGVVYTDKNNITPIFNGDIDEVRIWERALTQPQIQYIMNQEMVNNSSFVNGATLPDSVTLNEVSAVSWSDVQVYHNINNFYGTTVVDGSGNNNWLRIKYLVPGKQVIDNQTAPLPYVSTADTNWDLSTTWLNGDEQYIPGSASIVDSSVTVDWNIVQISSNVDMDNSLPAINNDTRKLLGLYIDSTKELTVNGSNPTDYNPDSGIGNGLTISHYFELNGTIDLEGESQLIQTTDSDLVVGTNGMLEKDQQGEGNRYRYNDWSLPVYTETGGNTAINGTGNYTTVAAALKDGTTPSSPLDITFVGGYDGDNTTSPIEIANYWIYKYANLPDGNYSAWQQVESTGDIYAGEGYLMKGVGDTGEANQNYVFQGKPNNGDITLTIGADNDYLVGNPYPSAIDGYQFLTDNAPASGVTPIKGSIYFWSHYGGDSHNLADYQAGYATLNLIGPAKAASAHPSVDTSVNGTVLPEQYIPVGQGFFVWAEDGGTIKFRNSQRYYKTEASGESIFMKGEQEKTSKTNSTEDTRPKIRIGFNAPSIDHRQLLVGADTKASDAIDWGYDSKMYEVFNDDMYWLIENDKYVIQGINTIDSDTELPIGIKSSQGGLISIEVDELINTPEDIEVYVLDKQTGLTYNIKNEAFETVLEANTNFSDKYAIVFKEAIALSVEEDEFLNTNMLVFMNNADKEIVIKNNTNVDVEGIQLINYLGQTSNEWNKSFDQNTINLPINVATGVYFIRINTPKGVVNKKIIIK